MKLRMLKAELWILGPKNPFCRFTWDDTVGCALCGWWMERLVRSRGLFLEPARLRFECRLYHV